MSSQESSSNSELKEILLSGRISILIDILNGSVITLFREVLMSVPGVFILIPGFIQLRGSIYSILSSNISSEIALGNIKIKDGKLSNTKRLIKELTKTSITSIVISTFLGIFSYFALFFTFKIAYPLIIPIAIVGSIISSLFLSIFMYFLILKAIKKGLDLDIISGPIITSLSDLIGTSCLFITVLLFII